MRDMREEVMEMLNDMKDYELVAIHNEYCDEVNYVDDRIYSMGEFNELYCMDGKSPLDIIMDAYGGSFNPNDDWFRWDGLGNLESTDYPGNDWIDIDEIADYIVENDDALRNDDIRDLMDEIEAENEEEEEEAEEEE